MECTSAVAPCIGIEQAIIASVGTGTYFIVLENNAGTHIGGTGVGGGTFIGLAARLLNITDPAEVEKLAETGDITKINHTMGELIDSKLSYLTSDFTASNFSKISGGNPNDVALGIHSLVGEVVGMMAAQVAISHKMETIIFTGAICKNRLICEKIIKCTDLFSLKAIFIDKPEFGTCFGGIMKYSREKYKG
jgi:type II pantothenate kinase